MKKIVSVVFWAMFITFAGWHLFFAMVASIWGGLSLSDSNPLCENEKYKVQQIAGWKGGCSIWQPLQDKK